MTAAEYSAMAAECEALMAKHVTRCGCASSACPIRLSLDDAVYELRRRARLADERCQQITTCEDLTS